MCSVCIRILFGQNQHAFRAKTTHNPCELLLRAAANSLSALSAWLGGDTRRVSIVCNDARSRTAPAGVMSGVWDSHANVLRNGGCMSPQRRPPQGFVAWCSSFTLSIVCVTERGMRQLGIVSDRAASTCAAVGDVTQSPGSHANVLSNRPCMPPQR